MRLALILVAMFVVGLGIVVGFRGLGSWRVREERLAQEISVAPTPVTCEFSIAAVGDVMLGRTVQEQMLKKNDWAWPFALTADRLKAADMTVGNLEAALVTRCYQKENRFILCARPEARAGLMSAGFDVLSMANNHTLNWGQAGYAESVKLLKEVGIDTVDKERVVIKEVCGVKVGIIGLDDVSAPLKLNEMRAQVASVAAQVEIPVVLIHWGGEYQVEAGTRQREVAQVLSEAGAKIVIGHHPHWVQPVEKVGDTLVFWSLGNFVFDQMWSEETRRGEIAEIGLQITDNRLIVIDYKLIPVKIYEFGQPRVIQSP